MKEHWRKLAPLCLIAVLLTALAIVLALRISPKYSAAESYLSFCSWDCMWYRNIAEYGYHSPPVPVPQNPEASNVAFFPGYPMLARVAVLLGVADGRIPLLLVSQFSCVLFWLSLLLLLRRWKVRGQIQALLIGSVFVHPAAFYLVMGYSESLFLASMLFFFYWTDDPDPKKRWLAAAAGFAMTTTRIVGLPVAIYPLLRWAIRQTDLRRPDFRDARQPLAIFLIASLGCGFFLAYCQWVFGNFQLYMLTQKIGWGIVPDYGALWKWADFGYAAPYERFSTIASGIGLVTVLGAELGWAAYSRKRPSPIRLPLYVCGCMIFYITLCGLKALWFRSMIRYTLPWWVLVALCFAQLTTRGLRGWRAHPVASGLALGLGFGALAIFGYTYEWRYLFQFLSGGWFA